MCVIIAKPANVEMPSLDILKAAHLANPDGCGFASTSHHYNGLNFKQFLCQLSKVDTKEPCIIHFRLATHGSVCRANCHPFCVNGVYFAHNGILDIKPQGDMTDSETAFRNIIYPAIHRYGVCSEKVDFLIDSIIGYSKFAILKGDRLNLYGNYIKLYDDCYYSNVRFLSRLYNWHSHANQPVGNAI